MATYESLLAEELTLPASERLQLGWALVRAVQGEEDLKPTSESLAKIQRRIDLVENGEVELLERDEFETLLARKRNTFNQT